VAFRTRQDEWKPERRSLLAMGSVRIGLAIATELVRVAVRAAFLGDDKAALETQPQRLRAGGGERPHLRRAGTQKEEEAARRDYEREKPAS
jgi:hypothetical protein